MSDGALFTMCGCGQMLITGECRRHSNHRPCEACPDGNEWTSDGPTGRACRRCGGKGYIEDSEEQE